MEQTQTDELFEIVDYIPDVILDIRYASKNNFTGKQLYSESKAWLRPEPLRKLVKISEELALDKIKLVVFDAFRPVSVQKKLRSIVSDEKYVREISNHCRGITVDVTLANIDGMYLDMGSKFDDFTELSHSNSQLITELQQSNRAYLNKLMAKYDFKQHPYEWWHFDYMPDKKWPIINHDLNTI